MTERVVVRQMGQLSNLTTPQGTMKTVGTSSEGLILEEHVSPTAELPDFQFLTHTIGVGHTTTPFSMFWRENGLEKAAPVGNGTLFLSTAKLQAGVRWTGLMRMDVLSIGIPTMEQALPEPFTRPPVELVTIKAAAPDLVLQHLLTALRIEFQRQEPSGKLLLEASQMQHRYIWLNATAHPHFDCRSTGKASAANACYALSTSSKLISKRTSPS
jgi:hypothetical protein